MHQIMFSVICVLVGPAMLWIAQYLWLFCVVTMGCTVVAELYIKKKNIQKKHKKMNKVRWNWCPLLKSPGLFSSVCRCHWWLILIRRETLNSLKETAKLDILNLLCAFCNLFACLLHSQLPWTLIHSSWYNQSMFCKTACMSAPHDMRTLCFVAFTACHN